MNDQTINDLVKNNIPKIASTLALPLVSTITTALAQQLQKNTNPNSYNSGALKAIKETEVKKVLDSFCEKLKKSLNDNLNSEVDKVLQQTFKL